MLLHTLILATLVAVPDRAAEAKTTYIVSAGRLNPQTSGLLIQADSAFQMQCGRALTLTELRGIHQSREFEKLEQDRVNGLTSLSRYLAKQFGNLPCNKKGA